MRRVFASLLVALVMLSGRAAQAQEEGVYVIPKFKFENGADFDNMKVGYVTFGKLNADRSNAILLVPGTSSLRHWADNYIGPGKTYDSDKYFLVSVDAIGGGTSSQPKDGLGSKFPAYTIRDLVRAQHELVTKGLGLNRLHAVAGPSMGGFQGTEWGVTFPGFAKGLVLIVPAARSDNHFRSIADSMKAVISLDPAYNNGDYTTNPTEGIRRAGTIYFPWLYSDEYLAALKTNEEYEKGLWAFGNAWSKTWDANGILLRYNASRNHDASVPFGGNMKEALGRVQGKALILASQTDRTIPAYLSRELYAGLKDATYVEIPTIGGHLGGGAAPAPGSAEDVYIAQKVRAFLDAL